MSTASMTPSGPTCSAAGIANAPVPHHALRTRAPGRSRAALTAAMPIGDHKALNSRSGFSSSPAGLAASSCGSIRLPSGGDSGMTAGAYMTMIIITSLRPHQSEPWHATARACGSRLRTSTPPASAGPRRPTRPEKRPHRPPMTRVRRPRAHRIEQRRTVDASRHRSACPMMGHQVMLTIIFILLHAARVPHPRSVQRCGAGATPCDLPGAACPSFAAAERHSPAPGRSSLCRCPPVALTPASEARAEATRAAEARAGAARGQPDAISIRHCRPTAASRPPLALSLMPGRQPGPKQRPPRSVQARRKVSLRWCRAPRRRSRATAASSAPTPLTYRALQDGASTAPQTSEGAVRRRR